MPTTKKKMSTTAITTIKKRKKKTEHLCVCGSAWSTHLNEQTSKHSQSMSTHMVSPPCVSWTRVIFCVFSKWQYYHALDHFLFIAHGTACRFKGKYVHTFSKLKKVIRKKLLIGLSKTKMIFWGSCQEKAPLSEALTWAKLKQKVTFAADLRGRRRKANTHNSTTVFVIL